MESYVPNEYPSLDKAHRVAFLGGSLDAVLLDSDDEEAIDKLSTRTTARFLFYERWLLPNLPSSVCTDAELDREVDERAKDKQPSKKKVKSKGKGKGKRKGSSKKKKQTRKESDSEDDDSDSDSDSSDSDSTENDEDELTESDQDTSEEERTHRKSNGLAGSRTGGFKLDLKKLNRLASGGGGGDDNDEHEGDGDDDSSCDRDAAEPDDEYGEAMRMDASTQLNPSIAAEKLRQHREEIDLRRLERMRKYATGVTKRPLKAVISSHQYAHTLPPVTHLVDVVGVTDRLVNTTTRRAFGTKKRGSTGKAKTSKDNDDDIPRGSL
jgi:hypothetical protein